MISSRSEKKGKAIRKTRLRGEGAKEYGVKAAQQTASNLADSNATNGYEKAQRKIRRDGETLEEEKDACFRRSSSKQQLANKTVAIVAISRMSSFVGD